MHAAQYNEQLTHIGNLENNSDRYIQIDRREFNSTTEVFATYSSYATSEES